MNFLNKIFTKTDVTAMPLSDPSEADTLSLEEFKRLSADNRMLLLMRSGDSQQVNMDHFKFFRYAIADDTDIHVKFAALKRIHLFKEHAELLPLMDQLKTENNYQHLEPYFSMALNRLGLISPEDFEKIFAS